MGQWNDLDHDPFSVSRPAKPAEASGFGSAFAQGFKRSLPETQSLLYGATAAMGGAVGADSVRDWGLKHYQRIHENQVAPLANSNTFQGSIKGEHSLGQWAGDTLGNFAGQGLQSAAAGLAGAAIGGNNPSGPVGAVVGGIGGVVAKEAGKQLITRQVRQLMKAQIASGASRSAARQAGQALAQRRLAQIGGGTLAATGLNIGQETGIGYSQRAQDAQAAGEALTRQDALRAIAWGIPAGLVDSAAEGLAAGRLLRGASASDYLPRRLLAGAAAGALTEGATEGIQAVMERAGAAQSLTNDEAIDDYIENLAAGALGGGAMGGVSGIRRRPPSETATGPTSPTPPPAPEAPATTDLPPNAPTAPYPAEQSALVRRLLTADADTTSGPLVSTAQRPLAPISTAQRPLAPISPTSSLARRTLIGEIVDPPTALIQQRPALPDPKSEPIEAAFTDLTPHSSSSPPASVTGPMAASDPSTAVDLATPASTPNPALPAPTSTGPLTRALTRHTPPQRALPAPDSSTTATGSHPLAGPDRLPPATGAVLPAAVSNHFPVPYRRAAVEGARNRQSLRRPPAATSVEFAGKTLAPFSLMAPRAAPEQGLSHSPPTEQPKALPALQSKAEGPTRPALSNITLEDIYRDVLRERLPVVDLRKLSPKAIQRLKAVVEQGYEAAVMGENLNPPKTFNDTERVIWAYGVLQYLHMPEVLRNNESKRFAIVQRRNYEREQAAERAEQQYQAQIAANRERAEQQRQQDIENTRAGLLSDEQASQYAHNRWRIAFSQERRALLKAAGLPAHFASTHYLSDLPPLVQQTLIRHEKTTARQAAHARQTAYEAAQAAQRELENSPDAKQWQALSGEQRRALLKAAGASAKAAQHSATYEWSQFQPAARQKLSEHMQQPAAPLKTPAPATPKAKPDTPQPPPAETQTEHKPAPSEPAAPTSKRLQILQDSLHKKEAKFTEQINQHFAAASEANGQPMNDKRAGAAWFKKLDKQNDTLRTLNKSVEKTKAAIEREQEKIKWVAAQSIPAPIQQLLNEGTLTQWRKHPNRFFVKGVEKGRIIWDETERKIRASHHHQIPNPEQYARFRAIYNLLRQQIADDNAQQENRQTASPQPQTQTEQPPVKAGYIRPIPLKLEGWTGTASELAALAREIYTQDLQGTSVENASLGARIAFTSEGKNEAFGAKGRLRSPVRAELVKMLDKLAESAVKVSEAAPAKGRESDTKAFHTLVNALEIGGQIVPVKLTIRQSANKPREGAAQPLNTNAHKFYDIVIPAQNKSTGSLGVVGESEHSPRPIPAGASDIKLADLAAQFKQEATKAPPPKPSKAQPERKPAPLQSGALVLQNRNRSTRASIEQMQAIAQRPDYLRTGISRSMDQGAPVVYGYQDGLPTNALIGRNETLIDGTGERFSSRYAVIEAADLITSHTADGSPRAEYGTDANGTLHAVAGNGRAAGINEAYRRGTAADYRRKLLADAAYLGIDSKTIASLKHPVLVRIIAQADLKPDMGDRSNITASAQLSPVEQAVNDSRRIDLSAVEFDDNGLPTPQSARAFVQAMPESERGPLLNPDGSLTRQGIDRITAAAFHHAYGNTELVRLYAQATDPQARTIIGALAHVAGSMAQLKGSGPLDIRPAVTEAAIMAVNARRQGHKLAEMVQQKDIGHSEHAYTVAGFFARHIRSGKRLAEGLQYLAQHTLKQQQIAQQSTVQTTLFGTPALPSQRELLESLHTYETLQNPPQDTFFARSSEDGRSISLIQRVKNIIRKAITASKHDPQHNDRYPLMLVAAEEVKEAAPQGLDISGYRHAIDGSAIRHTLKNHGNAKREQARGQLAISETDFEHIPDILAGPDNVIYGEKNKIGRDLIVYLKTLADGTTVYLEEVRTGKGLLVTQSMRKYPLTTSAASIVKALRPTSGTFQGNVQSVNVEPKPRNFTTQEPQISHSTPLSAKAHLDSVQAIVDGIVHNWPNAPEIIVAHDLNDSRIPEAVRRENAKQKGNPEGFYYQGKVYLIADPLKHASDVSRVLFHEVLGHVGLRGALGSTLESVLKDVARARRWAVAAKLKQYGLADTPQNRLIAAEEILADLAQTRPQLNVVQRALAAIRSWLRQHIPALRNLALTDSEMIRDYILPARAFVESRRSITKDNANTTTNSRLAQWSRGLNDLFKPVAEEAEAFRQALDKAMRSKGSANALLEVGRTPAVLRALGLANLPVTITRDVVRKATNGVKHNVDMAVIRNLPELLANPLAVLQSVTEQGAYAVLIDAVEKGEGQVMVALHPDSQASHKLVVNKIASVYGRAAHKYHRMVREGAALYVRTKNNPVGERVKGLQLPNSISPKQGSGGKVLFEADIVKLAQVENTNEASPLFSRAQSESVVHTINQSLQGPRGAAWRRVKQLFSQLNPKHLRENTRPAWLGALTLRHLAELGKDIRLNQVNEYANLVQQMATLRNSLQDRAAQTADTWSRFQRQQKAAADAMANVMFDATLAGVDPETRYTPLTVPEVQYGQQVFEQQDLTPATFRARRRAITAALKRARGQNRQVLLNQRQQLNARWQQEKTRLRAYPALQKRFAALPETGQRLYRQVRDSYREQSTALEQALIARIEALISDGNTRAATIARLRQQFESARRRGPYFPLQRFGTFWIHATDPHGKPAFMMYETVQAWQQAQRDLKAEGFTVEQAGRKLEDASQLRGASGSFITDLQHLLARNGASAAIRDEVYQLYLRTLPDVSLRKHYLHRKGTAGYSRDALRAYSANLFHGSFQIARLQFSHQLDMSLQAMKTQVKELAKTNAEQAAKAATLYSEMGKRHDWVMNPRDSKAANALTSLGFAWYLGATPAAALVNLSQTAIVSLPVLAAKFGTAKALKTLTQTMGLSLRSQTGDIQNQLNSEERAAYQQWHAMGTIDKSQAHNLAGLSETDSHAFNPHARRAMHLISWLFHRAEVVNREATALAAYRLARRSGMEHAAAVSYGHEAVMESHFDYSNANRARWMQSNAAKVLLLFRQYSLNMTWFLWRNLYQSLRGQDQQTKHEARTKLAGVLGMTGLFSGLMGMPLMSVLFSLADAAAAAFGDEDDDPFDSKVAFRNFLADYLGKDNARLLAKGPVDTLTGASIGARVSLDELWLRSPNRELEGHAMAHYLLEQAAGPLFGGMLTNTLRGLQQMHDGHTWRGVETLLPKALKDGLKALRYAQEGANTLKGDPLIEEMSATESLLQLSGFAPARLNERYEGMNAAKNFEQKLLDRRRRLMNAFLRARQRGDGPAGQRALDNIRAFNRKQPRLAITADTLRQSVRTRQRHAATAYGGSNLNPRIAASAQAQARFAE